MGSGKEAKPWNRNFSEIVAAIEGNFFWKSNHSRKVAFQKKSVMRNIAFLKN